MKVAIVVITIYLLVFAAGLLIKNSLPANVDPFQFAFLMGSLAGVSISAVINFALMEKLPL